MIYAMVFEMISLNILQEGANLCCKIYIRITEFLMKFISNVWWVLNELIIDVLNIDLNGIVIIQCL